MMGNPWSYRGHNLEWSRIRLLTKWDGIEMEYNASGMRTRKGDTYYELDGNNIISETTNGNTIRYYYGNGGIVGFRYNGNRYYYEKNLQGDIIGIYDESGSKVASYIYDAWGNCSIENDVSDARIGVVNSFRYRGYYYDSDIGLYYLKSRYYDAITGRFINADEIDYLGANGDLGAFNLFAYCSCNPVNSIDPTGKLPKWMKKVGDFFKNIGDAFLSSFEAEAGIGWGLGANISYNVTTEFSRDTYVGIDDGELITGNIITAEISIFDLGYGDSYNHLVEKGLITVSNSGKPTDGPFDMLNYPDVEKGSQLSIGPVSINSKGEVVLSVGVSAHFLIGGHTSIGFNISEFVRRLFD